MCAGVLYGDPRPGMLLAEMSEERQARIRRVLGGLQRYGTT